MNQSGITLVELLISLALSAVTLLTAMQFMGASLQSGADVKSLSNLYDKAQHAMSVFEHAISRAGFLGCGGRSAEVSSVLREDLRLVPELNLFEPYSIYRSVPGASSWTPSLDELPIRRGGTTYNAIDGRRGINAASLIPGNDLLVLRGLGFAASRILEPVQPGGSIELAARRRLGANDFAAVVDCQSVEVFRITSHGSAHGGAQLHRTEGLNPHDNHPTKLSNSRPFVSLGGEQLLLFPVQSEFFFIAASRGEESVPALWKKETRRSPAEILEGVAELEVRELADAHGHAFGLRIGLKVLSGMPDREGALARRFVRHFAFENL